MVSGAHPPTAILSAATRASLGVVPALHTAGRTDIDHRGAKEIEQAAREHPGFAAAFERTTGLPWSSQASIAKLLWLRASGCQAGPASTWLSVPE
jgi:sugar (pentulose or hexulose) kinase